MGGLEVAALAEDMRFPALADHVPVGVVAVHGDDHASAAGGDAAVHAVGVELLQPGFEGVDVVERGGLRDVATVEEGVDADLLHAFLLRLFEHALQVVEVAVDVAVGEEADEVERAALLRLFDQGFPRGALEHASALDGGGDELRALFEHAAAAHGVVPDFAVAHVGVAGEADRGAVRLQRGHREGGHHLVEERRVGVEDGVPFLVLADADAIHDDEDDRAAAGVERFILFQRFEHGKLS